ncbi:lipoprotein [Ralstonia sp. SET104]|nr:lipoprotein [Ralstonia sp. SET104]
MRWIALVACAALSACASSSQTFGPDGEVAYNLNCSGLARTWGMCLEKAGEICQTRGYRIISSSADTGALMTAAANPSGGFASGGTTISRSMVIACKQ